MHTKDLIECHRFSEPVWVTRPAMPSLDAYVDLLEQVWDSAWLTNEGQHHRAFEQRLCEYLGTSRVSLFCNGTISLLAGLRALGIAGGEVITSPFTFPATPHALALSGATPVFADIDPRTLCLDPAQIEHHITCNTKGILPVHVFGTPCDIEAIEEVAGRYGLPVLYDAAHAFGVQFKGRSIVESGELSIVSFHATKLMTTGEGGAVVSSSDELIEKVNLFRNFGITGEESVVDLGVNGKMSEFQAAFGLLSLRMLDSEIENRKKLAKVYSDGLSSVAGITCLEEMPDVRRNYAYFPILIDGDAYGLTRDKTHSLLKSFNIMTRKYFYPLCSNYPCYSDLPRSESENLPIAERVAERVLCLPIYGSLEREKVESICEVLRTLPSAFA